MEMYDYSDWHETKPTDLERKQTDLEHKKMDRPKSIFNTNIQASSTSINGTVTMKQVAVPENKVLSTTKKVTELQILDLGSASGKEIKAISNKVLEMHKGADQGEMGEKLDNLIKNAKGLNADNFKPGVVRKLMNKMLNIKYDVTSRFDTANDKINNLVKELESDRQHQYKLRQAADDLILGNANYCRSLMEEIVQAKSMLEQIADEIEQFDENNLSQDDARALADARNRYDMCEKAIVDLEGFKILSIQLDPKLVAFKSGVNSMINTFDTIVTKMIPAFMLYFADYLNSVRLEKSNQLANGAIDAFDEVIKLSGDASVKNMENIGRLKNRQLINVETIKQEHEKLITGLTQLHSIDAEARQNRANIMNELKDLEVKSIEAFSRKQ